MIKGKVMDEHKEVEGVGGGEEKNSDVTLYFWAPVALCSSAMAMV